MKKVVFIALGFIALVVILLIDWTERPKEWILGEWYESFYQVHAVVTPDTITMTHRSKPDKPFIFHYELIEDKGEIVAWRGVRKSGEYWGLFEFKGKSKLEIRLKTGANNEYLEEWLENKISVWKRVD